MWINGKLFCECFLFVLNTAKSLDAALCDQAQKGWKKEERNFRLTKHHLSHIMKSIITESW